MLVENAETRDCAEEQPEARATAVEDTQNRGGRGHPEERLERVHGEKAIEGEIDGGDKHAESGEKLSKPAATQFLGDPGGNKHFGTGSQGWQEAKGVKRIAEKSTAQTRKSGSQGRMINIAPGQMLAARRVVEFVAEIPVASGKNQMEANSAQGQRVNRWRERPRGRARQIDMVRRRCESRRL